MKPLLEGKVAIITGAGRGIGAAAATLFAQHGARLVINGVPAAQFMGTFNSLLENPDQIDIGI